MLVVPARIVAVGATKVRRAEGRRWIILGYERIPRSRVAGRRRYAILEGNGYLGSLNI